MTAQTPSETSLFARQIQHLVEFVSGSSNPPHPSERDLNVSETLELLVPERRQTVLEVLHASPQRPIPVSTLADHVACDEYDCDVETLTTEQRKRVYIALYQSHLPTLAQANVVSYDADESLVKSDQNFNASGWSTLPFLSHSQKSSQHLWANTTAH